MTLAQQLREVVDEARGNGLSRYRIEGAMREILDELAVVEAPLPKQILISLGEVKCEPTRDGEFMVLQFSPSERSANQVEVHMLLSGDDEARILRALGRA